MSDEHVEYEIIRKYFNGDNRLIATGLTLEEAKAHCNDPETSSSTCTTAEALEETERYGQWFDCFEEM